MAPEDGDPELKPGSSAAFAQTVDPSPREPGAAPPNRLPTGTQASSVAHEATVAAVLEGGLPPLPEVSTSHYQQEREIARGGMGKIMSAQDRRLGRAVALKQLLEPSPEQITRFQREALITARLQHPGIVPVYEAGRWPSGEPFFAM
jgi:serine/threonine protein kinase